MVRAQPARPCSGLTLLLGVCRGLLLRQKGRSEKSAWSDSGCFSTSRWFAWGALGGLVPPAAPSLGWLGLGALTLGWRRGLRSPPSLLSPHPPSAHPRRAARALLLRTRPRRGAGRDRCLLSPRESRCSLAQGEGQHLPENNSESSCRLRVELGE